MRRVDQRDTAVLPPAYQGYARRFAEVSAQLRRTMEQFGLPLAQDDAHELVAARKRLVQAGAHLRNDGKSIVYGALSPACERCRTGERSVSQFISLACPRNCWFCFNANQFDYNEYRSNRKDWRVEMDAYAQSMGKLDYVALTGGEPLLYPDEACAFFAYAKRLNPQAHCRLYTSGWGAGRGLFERLAESGLDEIRFSVKIDAETSTNREAPQAESLERQVSRISLAVGVVPSVMVEMPVVPGEQDTLRTVMRRLDDMGAFGINLLEFCFPLHNAASYATRGFALRSDPYRIPYDYRYAGALPVFGSEQAAYELMEWGIRQGLRLGMHYCSLENKNTAQIFSQNHAGSLDMAPYRFSQRDFFYKVLRVFGADAAHVAEELERIGAQADGNPFDDASQAVVAFDPKWLARLDADLVDGLVKRGVLLCASAVVESVEGGKERFREVGLAMVEAADVVRAREGGEMAWV